MKLENFRRYLLRSKNEAAFLIPVKVAPHVKSAYADVDFLAPVATESGGQGGRCRPRLELTRTTAKLCPKKLEQDIPVIQFACEKTLDKTLSLNMNFIGQLPQCS